MKSIAILVSPFALTAAFAAMAQSTAVTPSSQTQASASDGLSLEEVVVTAERRESTTQKTAATLNVVGGEELVQRGVTSLTDALAVIPAVQLQANNKGANINIRGVGTKLDSAAGDPGVNTNLDGVYLRQQSQLAAGLYDVARIEVLKGPQGTLYGRNSTGGVVNILSNDPIFDYEYRGSVTVGNYSLARYEGAFNVPLADDFAIRFAYGSERHTGYLDSGQDDADRIAGRIKMLWKPSEDFRLLVGASYSHDGGMGPGSVYATQPSDSRHAVYTHSPPGKLDSPVSTAFAQADLNLGAVTLTAIPTYSYYAYDYLGTVGGFYSQQRARERQSTMELRLTSRNESRVKWVGGLYYFDSTLANMANLVDSGIVNDQPNLGTKSYAGFFDATASVTNRFRLGAGVRYTSDERTQRSTTVTSGGTTVGPFDGDLSFDATTYRVGAQFDVAERSMLYATFATGYKAGGFYPDAPGHNTYEPEKLKSLEIGSKNRFLDDRLQANLSAYAYRYRNYQVSNLGTTSYGGLAAIVVNAQGESKVYGAELQLSYKLTENDRVDLSVANSHAEFGTFIIPAAGPSPERNLTGLEMPASPKLNGSVAYQHTWSLPSGALTARADVFYSSSYWAEFTHARPAQSHQSGYTISGVNVNYAPEDAKWWLGAFVKNLEDSRVVSQLANTANGDYSLQAPRTYGVTLGAHF